MAWASYILLGLNFEGFSAEPLWARFFKKSSKNGPTAKSLCFEGFLLKLSGISFCNNDSTHSATGDLVK
jgi:hypothetical protein